MLELYQTETCPHCGEVRETLSELGVSCVIHNPRLPGSKGGEETNPRTHDELQTLGGEDQIPFLVDTARNETLYGSEEIVEYLRERYS
jgi:glutaredoxin